MTTTTTDFITRLDTIIEERSLLTHPFYQAWNAGTLPVESLKEYAKQYFHFEAAFPRFLSAVHSRCESPAARQAILGNLWDEEHGADNHRALWLRFCESLGLSEAEVVNSEAFPETRELVDGFMAACEQDVALGLATLYAYEAQAPAVARQKIIGLKQFYGIEDARSIAFFSVHQDLDVDHSAAERDIIAAACETDSEREAAEAAVRTAADRLWRFLDGAYATANQ
jgi:pyrroloquinoline-quinone synthase